MKTINLLIVALLLATGINSTIFAEISNVNIYNKRIPTKSAEIDASLYLTVYEPADNAIHPAIVMCPGSWEYGDVQKNEQKETAGICRGSYGSSPKLHYM